MGGNKCISMAADFMQMEARRGILVPEFVGGPAVEGGGRSEIGKVGSCCSEFVPKVGGALHARCMVHALLERVQWRRSAQPLWAEV